MVARLSDSNQSPGTDGELAHQLTGDRVVDPGLDLLLVLDVHETAAQLDALRFVERIVRRQLICRSISVNRYSRWRTRPGRVRPARHRGRRNRPPVTPQFKRERRFS